ncbi:MAG: thiamine pyrophosphate-binding protein [Rhodospirillaceae bacterium]|nr:MAG: thiamine pyrophosphate-binding protein [Rhodospirillaceae bacterium]
MTNDANANHSLTLAERIADTLAINGVRRMFGVPGGGSSLDLIDAAADRGIEFVLCRTETAAAIMAAVTGELTGIPGVVLTGIGPGAASVVNGIAYASLERAPLVVFTDAHDETATAPPHQIFDQPSLFGPISKAQERLSPPDGATSFELLFELAAAEPPGPVHIDLSARDAGADSPAPSPWDRASPPNQETAPLEHASELLASARRPVLIVGLQCRHDERAGAVNTLAGSLGCPVMTTYKAKGIVTEAGPLNVGLYTGAKLDNTFLAEADLIVFCGVDPVEMIPGNWPHSAPVIVLSETPRLAWPFEPDIEIAAPVAYSANYLAGRPSASTWTEEEIGSQKTRLREIVANNATVGRSPDEIIDAAAAAVPTNARLAVDAGAHMFSAMSRWPASAPHDVLKSNGLSTMGYAVPAALASWLEQTDRPAVAITGDGGMMMSLAELSTAARLGANLTVIVLNDAALSLIDIKQQRQQRPPLGVRYSKSDFATAARGMGCDAWTVGGQDPLEFALAEAFEANGPTLIDVSVDPSGYRDQLTALRG